MASQRTTKTTVFDTISKVIFTYSKQIFLGILFVAVLVIIFFAHKLWVAKREQAAQYDFSALISEYDLMMREKNPQWLELLNKFEDNYKKHAYSSLLPYYQSYKVHILLRQGERDAALATLDEMITTMKASPIIGLYEMERALVKLDSNDIAVNNAGLDELKKLAYDSKNIYNDSAMFYLGRYYWATDQIDDARLVWQKLVDDQRDEKIAPSPWVSQVQEFLQLTIA